MAVLLAIVGHDLLHTVQRWLTYVMIAVFGVLTVSALRSLEADAALGGTPAFSWSAFLVQLSAAAGYQISYASTSPTTPATCRTKRRPAR